MSDQSSPRAWYAVAVLTLCYVFSLLDRLIVSLLVEPIKNDLALDDLQIALIQGPAFAIFYATMSVPLGRLGDRVNRRNLVAIAIAAWSICTAMCGLARSFTALFLARIGVGVGEAALTPSAYSMMADSFSRARLGRAISVYTVGGIVGAGLSLMVGGIIYGFFETWDSSAMPWLRGMAPWQLTFIAVGLPGIALALLVRLTVAEPARQEPGSWPSIRAVLAELRAQRQIYFPALGAYAFVCAIAYGFSAWAPSYLIRTFALGPKEAGVALGTVMLSAGVAGPLFAGWIADRLQMRHGAHAPLRVLTWLFAAVVVAGSVAFRAPTVEWALAGCAVLAFAQTATLGMVPLTIQLTAPNRMRGQISGLNLMIGNLVGFGTGPVIVAVLSEKVFIEQGLRQSLSWCIPAFALLGFVLCASASARSRPDAIGTGN